MPVAKVMALYRNTRAVVSPRHGRAAEPDVTASRTGDTLFLHVINTSRTQAHTATVAVAGMAVRGGTAFTIAADPEFEIMAAERDPMRVRESKLTGNNLVAFPAASVTALELTIGAGS